MSDAGTPLRVVEIGGGLAGAVCGRLFAGFGHRVIRCEPPDGDPLRQQPPQNAAGDGLLFVALNADKDSIVLGRGADGTRTAHDLLDRADVAIVDASAAVVSELDLDPAHLRQEWPQLVAVRITGLGQVGDYEDLPGDSLLAEAYGGLATMIGEPADRPLSLGGQQSAYCSGVTGFFAAMLALRRRDLGADGDVAEVAMCDVAAYMDWKSDVTYAMTGQAPRRSGVKAGGWRLVPARDGWVGFIFQQEHWQRVVQLVGAPELADPSLMDPFMREAKADEWWPAVERWTAGKSAEDVYQLAQKLGLPFGWVARPSDLAHSAQLHARGFLVDPVDFDGSTPAVKTPVHSAQLTWRSGRVGKLEAGPAITASIRSQSPIAPLRRQPAAGVAQRRIQPLDGVVVLDFGTITAGAAVTRLLADYGATVMKVEWLDHPDTFRVWKMPTADDIHIADRPTSPYFASNNIGKLGLAINLKSEEGRRLVYELAARSHVLVENYRVGVSARLGIDADTLHRINPELVYLSLSSQGQDGPEAAFTSYGSTLDLLSGLAAVTGYRPDQPLWSSSDVNYPDQLVSLFGAALVVYGLQRGIKGLHLDISQREIVSWTLAAEIADFLLNRHDSAPDGNRRAGCTPHDTYPCCQPDTWIAVSCTSDEQRDALAHCLGTAEFLNRDVVWWRSHQDRVDTEVTQWTSSRRREQAVVQLRDAGVPAVPVLDAADRAAERHFAERQVLVPGRHGVPVKGLPVIFRDLSVSPSTLVPGLGQHTGAVLQELCGLSEAEIADLHARGVIFCAPPSNNASGPGPTDRRRANLP